MKVTLRLTGQDTPLTWSVPQEGVMATKENKGKKYINYYPGQDSNFTEDITNKDIKPSKVPDFTYNALAKATELTFDDSDISLFNYLTKQHPWANRKWKIFSKELEAKESLMKFDDVEKALEYIKQSDEDKIKAIAMAIFGLTYFYKSNTQCSAELKAKAVSSPKEIIDTIEADTYETKFVAGLALVSGIVKINQTHTAIVWSDSEGVIVHVAQGENGLDKLSEFLRKQSPESLILMQEFQERLDTKLNKAAKDNEIQSKLSEKDREIAELKAILVNYGNIAPTATFANEEATDLDVLKEAQEQYVAKFNKQLPAPYKTNLEWINKKLQE
jgi:hypothetical protein